LTSEVSPNPVVRATSVVLAHVPSLVRHGSKPAREIRRDPSTWTAIIRSLRSFEEAVSYPPHRSFLGEIHPRSLPDRPWVGRGPQADRFVHGGEIMPEEEFIGLLAAVDEFKLISLSSQCLRNAAGRLASHPLAKLLPLEALEARGKVRTTDGSVQLHLRGDEQVGVVRAAHEEDEALSASVLLENFANKASALLAVLRLLNDYDVDPHSIDYVIGCGEEATGDRYQRGGGNMAKAVAAAAGLKNASGMDVKNFCAAPIPAMVFAGSLVHSRVFRRILVIGGGSLPKLGMKFQGHLSHGLPILEDVLGAIAVLIEADDGEAQPLLRLDGVGYHRVGDGGSNPQIMSSLVFQPLDALGLRATDVDDYATELHNPEITEPQGSGNVPERNYRTIAALAAARGDIDRQAIPAFVEERGMPGFAPTQGHLASALCYIPHAVDRLTRGPASRVQFVAKGSLFLGRMTNLSDGMSVMLERNST
jgi:hypothetical protein